MYLQFKCTWIIKLDNYYSNLIYLFQVLHEHFHRSVHVAFIIKPENFWQKQRTSLAKQKKYNFEVKKINQY